MSGKIGYTKLTYGDIVNQITSRINSDPQFQTFRETAVAKTILELFAGMTDLINFYIERRSEESYLHTAKLRTSAIELSKQLGYIVQRPIPANASISMTFRASDDDTWNGVDAGDFIQLPMYSSFTFNGNKFLLKNVYTYTFTADDIANLKSDPTYFKTIQYGLFNNESNYHLYKDADLVDEEDLITMDIIQAEKKYYFIEGVNNEQAGEKFQVYNIPDATFSNMYGDRDLENALTKIAISDIPENIFETGTVETSAYEYKIDRRSLLQTASQLAINSDPVKVCLVSTNMDETVDLKFGDDLYSAIGAVLGEKDNISIQYLSTLGNKGNSVGVVGQKTSYDGTIFTNKSVDLTPQFEFKLTTDVVGGADMESVASIQANAPAIYYSLDRCVTNGDYKAYLKTITSPIFVKNAIAWGEQEEGGSNAPIEKLFNVALYSCFGELYRYNSVKDTWVAKESDTGEGGDMADAVLDDVDLFGASPGGSAMPDNHYFYVISVDDSPGNNRDIDNAASASPNSKLGIVYANLKTRSMMTVKNVYVSPIIQEFSLDGTIFVNKMADADALSTKIQNDIYSYMNNSIDFNTKIYVSNLIELIEKNEGVIYCNVELVPTVVDRDVLGVDGENVFDAVLGDSSVAQWLDTFSPPYNEIQGYYTLSADIASEIYGVWHDEWSIDPDLDSVKNTNMDEEFQGVYYKHFMTESWLWNSFIKRIYDLLNIDDFHGFVNTIFWDQLAMKIKNTFSYAIRYNMLVETNGSTRTKKDDVISYTLRTELPKLTFEAGVMYK